MLEIELNKLKMEYLKLITSLIRFEIDGKKCEEILVKSKALEQRLETMMENYKRELLNNQIFQLTTPDMNIDQIFGYFVFALNNNLKVCFYFACKTLKRLCYIF